MPNLGNKHECFNCGAKFYDLAKPEAICPKCGANQKDAKLQVSAVEATHTKRRKRDEVVKPPVEEEEEPRAAEPDADAEEGLDDDDVEPEEEEEADFGEEA